MPPGVAARVASAAAAAGVSLTGLTASQIAQTAAKLTASLLRYEASAFVDATAATLATLALQFPDKPRADLKAVLSFEQKFEIEFRRKMKERLDRDLPKALSIVDPADREAAVRQIMEREKRYSLMREEAMLQRALGKMEAQLLEVLSPEGAFWKLSPHVKQHTLDCLAMGNRFWPWSVLKRIQPPLHAGCPCYLLGMDEAIEAGVMAPGLVPDPADAEARYAQLKQSVTDLEDRDDLAEAIEEVFCEIAARDLPLEEARRRIPLRWHKGFDKGGEFRPTRGGGAHLIKSLLGDGSTPVRGRERGHGRWTWVRGVYTRIPEQRRWEARRGGHVYHSPPGSTVLYRDGDAISGPGRRSPARERRNPGTSLVRNERIETLAEQIRAEARSVVAERGGVQRGDGATALLGLIDRGFKLERSKGDGNRMVLTYRAPEGEQLDVTFDGEEVLDVAWGGKPISERKSVGNRAPKNWDEYASDTLAWADELGRRFNAEVQLPTIRANPDMGDHSGTHMWDGRTEVGLEAQTDIERAGKARQEMRDLEPDELRGIYSSYWVTSHEIAHAVNPIAFNDFNGASANMEEALTEEWSHQAAIERLTEQGQLDVVDWAANHPNALAVRGTYPQARDTLGRLIERAGIVEPDKKRKLIEELKFKVDPSQRLDVMATLIHRQYPSASLDEIRGEVEADMKKPQSFGEKPELLRTDLSPGMAAVGRGQYGKLATGTLSADGTVLAGLPDGSRRAIEKLPLMETFPELASMTDGTAIVNYGANQKATSGLTHRDGSAKRFRYIDNEDRARLILRALAGKGSPGVHYEVPSEDVAGLNGQAKVAAALDSYRRDTASQRIAGFSFTPPKTDHGSTAGDDAPNTEVSLTPKSYAEYQASRAAQKERLGGKMNPGTEPEKPQVAELLLPDPPQNPGAWLSWFPKRHKDGKFKKDQGQIFSDKPKAPPKDEFIGGKKGVKDDGPIPNYDGVKLKLGKGAGGSNGARWAFDEDGGRWLLKSYKGDPDRIATEILANRAYAAMGAKVADAGTIHTKDGKIALTYKALDGAPKEYIFKRGKPSREVGKHYMADALLANWDFAGMTDDNIMWDDSGKPFRVDQGGTFEYKAMGGAKPYGPVPTEVWTMIQKGQAKRASAVTEPEMRAQGLDIEKRMTGPVIDALVDAAPFKDEAMKERIRENMKARVAWMGAFGRGEIDLPKPLTGSEAQAAFIDGQDDFKVYPKEIEALNAYVGGGGFALNNVLKGKGERTPEQKQMIKAMDEVLKASRTSEDMHLYIGVDLPVADLPAEMMGRTLGDAGYAHATTDLDAAGQSQGVIKLLLPSGSKALYLPDLLATDDSVEPQVIMPRGSRLKLTGVNKDGQLEATVLPPEQKGWGPPPKKPYTGGKYGVSKPTKAWEPHGEKQSSIWDDVNDGMGKMNPGTGEVPDHYTDEGGNVIMGDPRDAKGGISLPHFNTPDPAARQENIDAAKALRDLALNGDADGLKAFKVNPKAKKLAAFRYAMISHVLGPKDGEITPITEPLVKTETPAEALKAVHDPEIEAKIVPAQEALAKDFGLTFLDPKGPGRIRSKGWLNILTTIRPEIESMEKRWPGITKGVKLSRAMPHGGALGVFDTGAVGDIKLVPTSKIANAATNKHGVIFSIGGGELGTVFRHEFAHHRDWQTKAKYRDAIKQTIFRDEKGNPITPKEWGKRNISTYSGTMTSEFIAEAWALYTSSGYDGSMGERMDAIMEAMGTGGEPPAPELDEPVGGHIV